MIAKELNISGLYGLFHFIFILIYTLNNKGKLLSLCFIIYVLVEKFSVTHSSLGAWYSITNIKKI